MCNKVLGEKGCPTPSYDSKKNRKHMSLLSYSSLQNPADELDPYPNRTQRFGLISLAEMAAPSGTEQKDEKDDVQRRHYPHIMYGAWCYAIGLPMERY